MPIALARDVALDRLDRAAAVRPRRSRHLWLAGARCPAPDGRRPAGRSTLQVSTAPTGATVVMDGQEAYRPAELAAVAGRGA
jgi:hypothetical protein